MAMIVACLSVVVAPFGIQSARMGNGLRDGDRKRQQRKYDEGAHIDPPKCRRDYRPTHNTNPSTLSSRRSSPFGFGLSRRRRR